MLITTASITGDPEGWRLDQQSGQWQRLDPGLGFRAFRVWDSLVNGRAGARGRNVGSNGPPALVQVRAAGPAVSPGLTFAGFEALSSVVP